MASATGLWTNSRFLKRLETFSSNKVELLVLGMCGIGKSTLINGLLGCTNSATEGNTLSSTTRDFKCYSKTVQKFELKVWDTPGLLDPELDSTRVLTKLKEMSHTVDIFLVCFNMGVVRLSGSEIHMINMITDILGKEIWNKTLIILLQANHQIARIRDYYNEDVKKQFQDVTKKWKDFLQNEIASQYIQIIPVGHRSQPMLFNNSSASWIDEVWETVFHFLIGDSDLTRKENYLDEYYEIIASKESLDLLFLKFLFLGPPSTGKTTLRRRLLKEIVDLISAGEQDKSQPSTGTVQSSDVVVTGESINTAVITESDWSALEGIGDEVQMLIYSLRSTAKTTQVSHKQSQLDSIAKHDRSASSFRLLPYPSHPYKKGAQQQQPTPVIQQDILDPSHILEEVIKSKDWEHVKHTFKACLRMEDTGGQPELMDMLPALTLGPGLYLLFINLQNDLNHHYNLTYRNASGDSTPPIESAYSVKEMLLSSLSSISCSNASSSVLRPTNCNSYIEDMQQSSKSVAYIVGTHKDKVSNERIEKINNDIKKVIMPTQFYKKNIVQFASETDVIVALDNMAGGVEEVKKVRKLLEKSMEKHFKKIKIPAVWLFFSLYLRQHDKRTATLDHCLHLSNKLGMSADETEVALWFLHHHAGVLMYFPNVPELKDLVIIDVQVVYDSVTVLILQAMNHEKIGHRNAEVFKKTGRFTLSCITEATRKISGDHIPVDKLVALLEYLHIIARISSDEPSSLPSSSLEEATYMMPCVLPYATMEQLNSMFQTPQEIIPMLFHFICGAVPIGLFPALISCLITTKSFKFVPEGFYKNIVKFRYGEWRTLITLVCQLSFFEIHVSTCTKNVELHEECFSIRNKLTVALVEVASRFNYGSLIDYQYAFDCPTHPDCMRHHLCVIDRNEQLPKMMDCLENADDPQPVELSQRHKIWFGQKMTSVPQLSSNTYNSEDMPTLDSLISFECPSGEKINILDEIGGHFQKFGICLLKDEKGNKVERLIIKHLNDSEKILIGISKLWLEGTGRPVSWQTLVSVLKDVELTALAEKIQPKAS